jgi:hypothetical protein
LSFAERGTFFPKIPNLAPEGQVTLEPQCWREPGFRRQFPLGPQERFRPRRGAWRQLALEVTPELVRAYWGGRPDSFAHGLRSTLLDQVRQGVAAHPPPLRPASEPALAFDGGLGLFVHQGAAAFRRVVLKPLPAE